MNGFDGFPDSINNANKWRDLLSKGPFVTTVSIHSLTADDGSLFYQAVAGDCHVSGATPGEALDAVAAQVGPSDGSLLIVLQSNTPDSLFTQQQCDRLRELMHQWRTARDRGDQLSPELQEELDTLAQAELRAAGIRAAKLVDELNP